MVAMCSTTTCVLTRAIMAPSPFARSLCCLPNFLVARLLHKEPVSFHHKKTRFQDRHPAGV
jgi:hypothetical protein